MSHAGISCPHPVLREDILPESYRTRRHATASHSAAACVGHGRGTRLWPDPLANLTNGRSSRGSRSPSSSPAKCKAPMNWMAVRSVFERAGLVEEPSMKVWTMNWYPSFQVRKYSVPSPLFSIDNSRVVLNDRGLYRSMTSRTWHRFRLCLQHAEPPVRSVQFSGARPSIQCPSSGEGTLSALKWMPCPTHTDQVILGRPSSQRAVSSSVRRRQLPIGDKFLTNRMRPKAGQAIEDKTIHARSKQTTEISISALTINNLFRNHCHNSNAKSSKNLQDAFEQAQLIRLSHKPVLHGWRVHN